MNGWVTTTRRRAASWPLALLVLAATGCTVRLGWSGEYVENILMRTPPTFATACQEVGGTLVDGKNQYGGAQSTCTMPNGDANTCDWQLGICRTVCHSSEQECAIVRYLAFKPVDPQATLRP